LEYANCSRALNCQVPPFSTSQYLLIEVELQRYRPLLHPPNTHHSPLLLQLPKIHHALKRKDTHNQNTKSLSGLSDRLVSLPVQLAFRYSLVYVYKCFDLRSAVISDDQQMVDDQDEPENNHVHIDNATSLVRQGHLRGHHSGHQERRGKL